jgi:hypothetical protein
MDWRKLDEYPSTLLLAVAVYGLIRFTVPARVLDSARPLLAVMLACVTVVFVATVVWRIRAERRPRGS